MINLQELIDEGSTKLRCKNIKSHKLDSEILMSTVLGKKREEVITNLKSEIKNKDIIKFENLIQRRSLCEPIAYILSKKEFWSKTFEVSRHTLIPRPETELIVEKLVKIYKDKKIFILDIGTGSGCIIVSLLSELIKSSGIAIDISKKALLVAKKNAKNYHLFERLKFFKKSFLEIYDKKFDLIVSTPPYVESRAMKNLDDDIKKYEPKIALDGGNDGLDVIKKVIYKSKYILKTNGTLALEIGNGQLKSVSKILLNNNYRIEHYIKDFKDNTRCIISKFLGNCKI